MVLKIIALVLIVAAVLASTYVRLAPVDTPLLQSWILLSPPGERTWANGHQVVREVEDPKTTIAVLGARIMASPRTVRVSGSVEVGIVSYVTRSAVWGFPDFTTIYGGPDDTVDGGHGPLMRIDGRAVFGVSDLGVNKARIEGWLAQLDGDTPTQ